MRYGLAHEEWAERKSKVVDKLTDAAYDDIESNFLVKMLLGKDFKAKLRRMTGAAYNFGCLHTEGDLREELS